MKRILIVSLAMFLALFAIPLLTAGQPPRQQGAEGTFPEEPSPAPSPLPPDEPSPVAGGATTEPSTAPAPEPSAGDAPAALPTAPALRDADVSISVLTTAGTVSVMPLRDFLAGATASEMPALYPEEALKAQAVAIRTLAYYALENPYHNGAPLCGNWECCLAYEPLENKQWGERYEEYAAIICAAVDATDGEIAAYQGEPIEAAFFAASPGRTRSAAEVWGAEVPYLQSVDSAFDAEFPGGPRGHGVGMSQFGARQLALEGYSYTEILQWYYTGVEIIAVQP